MSPQVLCCATHVVATHNPTPQTLGVPAPPQLCPVGQPPGMSQLIVEPQPSVVLPQFLPSCAHVFGVQPQTFAGPPPPHVFGSPQPPQLTMGPQPLSTAPQSLD